MVTVLSFSKQKSGYWYYLFFRVFEVDGNFLRDLVFFGHHYTADVFDITEVKRLKKKENQGKLKQLVIKSVIKSSGLL